MATGADSALSPPAAGALAAAVTFVAFATASVLLFDHLPVALVAGGFGGVGVGLVVPYVIRYRAFGEASDVAAAGMHSGAIGAAFAATGVVVVALTAIFDSPALAVGFGVPLAAVEYLVWAIALPQVAER